MEEWMFSWTMAEAKRDFKMGHLKGFTLEREVMGDGWYLTLKHGGGVGPLVDAREKQPRMFRSLDAAIAAAEQVGFRVVALVG
jgi:hypothetical protein